LNGFLRFGLKIGGDGFFQFDLKTSGDGFSRFDLKTVVCFLVEPQNQDGRRFFCLGLKTNSYGLVIWAPKSPRRFLDLGLKTKQTTVYRVRHKIDRRTMAWDTH
jgi:hypothetical protein